MEKGKFRIVSVDTCTVSCGDIDFSRIEALGEAKFYDVLTPDELASAAAAADALLVNKAEVTRGLLEKCLAFCYLPWSMGEVYGKTMGIYGYGNIGRAVARAAEAFGMKVIVHTRSVPQNCPYELVSADEIFERSDYLSLHCPLSPATEKIVNARTLALMKPSAVLINTARGGLVDEYALAGALNGGKIAGACTDVLTREPMERGNPLLTAKNCIITPHIAWGPRETRARLVDIVAENLAAFLAGRPQNVVPYNK